ncbi:MAG: hypothetical protein K2Q09_06460, partial [Phycisphaerales bacterium]|nr:hypothetical protein [Phycisphaerales bacterium]
MRPPTCRLASACVAACTAITALAQPDSPPPRLSPAPAGEPVGPPLTLPIQHGTAPGNEWDTPSSGSSTAHSGIDRPSFAGRQVSVFDFEEQAYNPEDVPRNWYRAQDAPGRARRGFPRWNQAIFDSRVTHSGTASVMLPTKGGSTSLRLGSGVIQVFPDAEYRVSAYIRTEGLRHAGA